MISMKWTGAGVSALALAGVLPIGALHAQQADNAARFGALESILDVSLSPDGNRLAFIEQGGGATRSLYIVDTADGAKPRNILSSDGKESGNLSWCGWVTSTRLACQTFIRDEVNGEILGATNIIAIDADGGNLRLLSKRRSHRSLYADFRGGSVVDWSSTANGSLLMTRSYVPESSMNTRIAERDEGLGVDRVDTIKTTARRVVTPNRDAISYLSDGQGNVRIMATQGYLSSTGQFDPKIRFFFRPKEGGSWQLLSQTDVVAGDGFEPAAVDAATNRVYGFGKVDGRKAVIAMALDGSGATSTIYAHPEVDVDEIMRIGRNGRIVGVSFATDQRKAVITDAPLAKMTGALSKALGGKPVVVTDASADESRYLIRTESDTDPGAYFLYTPKAKELRPLLFSRDQLSGTTLSPVKAITYPAADGTMVPGYLTLPPGRSDAKGLPAIVMPHGGPSARDEWGFDWLAQYFAQTGYAVLQPNYRGSSGYGDAWYQNNGFQSWKTAMGDITDGGRWLTASEGADLGKLSIVGWSYGGYAALQSGVIAPDLFKAIVAIAPVTDLQQLKVEASREGSGRINARFIGAGPHIREGSPAQNAGAIKAPVLMFHGTFDQNVDVAQARTMRRALESSGKRVELVEYPELAHSLETGEARTDMLRKISAFLPH
ncbi:Dipeptidyl aminopeptidase/acylaminoacyl peptidase [Sphingopyxis sp. YR583]|jgi:dipeptidyl aminopeptidase/acylaminoacyl peptidase|uniref:S9 family peptidase n=1 Tax=Sphingopyxis sp. YR583 TaxID=1881047 RepID=UPI0008A752AB|nr:S9 family peptidase [Sphingopyxis sp. YR583]SEH20196.1 Dipeptidyl aminopeptidase/acylaminoacyl peptidase [Sphingopyxis sp. YR583]